MLRFLLFILPGRWDKTAQASYSQWASRKVSTSAWATLAPSSRAVISPFRFSCRTTLTTCSCFTYCSSGSFKYSGRDNVIVANLTSVGTKPRCLNFIPPTPTQSSNSTDVKGSTGRKGGSPVCSRAHPARTLALWCQSWACSPAHLLWCLRQDLRAAFLWSQIKCTLLTKALRCLYWPLPLLSHHLSEL